MADLQLGRQAHPDDSRSADRPDEDNRDTRPRLDLTKRADLPHPARSILPSCGRLVDNARKPAEADGEAVPGFLGWPSPPRDARSTQIYGRTRDAPTC